HGNIGGRGGHRPSAVWLLAVVGCVGRRDFQVGDEPTACFCRLASRAGRVEPCGAHARPRGRTGLTRTEVETTARGAEPAWGPPERPKDRPAEIRVRYSPTVTKSMSLSTAPSSEELTSVEVFTEEYTLRQHSCWVLQPSCWHTAVLQSIPRGICGEALIPTYDCFTASQISTYGWPVTITWGPRLCT